MMARLSVMLILLALSAESFEQSITRFTLASAGSSVSLPDISIESTVGQTPFRTLSNDRNYLTQGFEQPTPIVKQTTLLGEFIQAFPNPVVDDLKMIISVNNPTDFYIKIFTLAGYQVQSLFAPKLKSDITYLIHFTGLPDGMYLLYVYEASQEKRLFKVIKVDKVSKSTE